MGRVQWLLWNITASDGYNISQLTSLSSSAQSGAKFREKYFKYYHFPPFFQSFMYSLHLIIIAY